MIWTPTLFMVSLYSTPTQTFRLLHVQSFECNGLLLKVRALAGPNEKQKFIVTNILPYNPATAKACIDRGERVHGNGERMSLIDLACEILDVTITFRESPTR
jgi:hypothetical protein